MALSKIFFPIIRSFQLLILVPTWGILAYFVHKYASHHQTIPAEILVLFIASVVGTAWALVSFFQFHHSIGLSVFVFLMDMIILGGLIAGVVLLRGVRNQSCTAFSAPLGVSVGTHSWSWDHGNGWSISFKKSCMMLKTAWVFGIISCVLFLFSALLALLIHRRNERVAVREKGYVGDERRPARRGRWF